MARAARTRGRGGALRRARRASGASPPRGRSSRHPRSRGRRRCDGPLAGAAPALAAALGGARPRRRPPGARGRHPSASGRHRRDPAVRRHPAGAERSRRREPHRRLGAARHPGGGRAGPDAPRVHRRRVPDVARADRGRSRQPPPGGFPRRTRGRRLQRPPAPPARPRRRRSRRRRAQGHGRRGARRAEPVAPGCGRRRPDGRVARGLGRRGLRAGARAGGRGRRLPRAAPGAGGGRASWPSASATSTCWCCRDDRAPRSPSRAVVVGAPRRHRRDARRPGLAPRARGRSSTACARSTAGRWRPRPASPC